MNKKILDNRTGIPVMKTKSQFQFCSFSIKLHLIIFEIIYLDKKRFYFSKNCLNFAFLNITYFGNL
jgi:hypothetical protein